MAFLLLLVLRPFTWILGHLPPGIAIPFLTTLIHLALRCKRRYFRIARRNLEIAFNDKSAEWREKTLQQSIRSLARVFHDACRSPYLSDSWYDQHLEVPYFKRYIEIKNTTPKPGILFATGHLGSFELLAQYLPIHGFRMAFVVRNLRPPAVDRWWTGKREVRGNTVISRAGAFREMSEFLAKGTDVGILFDQNVTRNHAVFTSFFGKEAATTRAVALAAIKHECPVVVVGIVNLPHDKYRVDARECDFSSDYASADSREEKVERITKVLNEKYEAMVREYPEGWFWFHRRWRTRPEGEEENPYHGC